MKKSKRSSSSGGRGSSRGSSRGASSGKASASPASSTRRGGKTSKRSSSALAQRKSGGSSRGKGTAHVTTDHEEIRRWVEQRGGHPACVVGTGKKGDCLLRIDYPGYGADQRLQPIEWDEFFEKFDEENLAFLYQERTSSGDPSRFSKFVDQRTASGSKSRGRGRHGR